MLITVISLLRLYTAEYLGPSGHHPDTELTSPPKILSLDFQLREMINLTPYQPFKFGAFIIYNVIVHVLRKQTEIQTDLYSQWEK